MPKFYERPNIDFYALDEEWLSNRMLFIAGPRQVGKTTYAKNKINQLGGSYFNWDDKKVRNAYALNPSFFDNEDKSRQLIIFDEIHKMRKWKNILKGAYDVYKSNYRFIITGSAKLDTFRKSGDSLVGRYFLTHMFPLSVGDLINNNFKEYIDADSLLKDAHDVKPKFSKEEMDQLINLGGFPEPFFKNNYSFKRRWTSQHQELLIREDLRDLSNIRSLDAVEHLILLLEPKVSSLCVTDPLARTLEVDFKTIRQWLLQLEKIMLIFSIKPWDKRITRSLHKSSKVYFYDWASVSSPGAKLENFVASQLFKACTLWQDRYGYKYDLNYIRTYDGAEVDFLITCERKPWLLIEVKHGQPDVQSSLHRFKTELNIPALLLTNLPKINTKKKEGISIMSLERFLSILP